MSSSDSGDDEKLAAAKGRGKSTQVKRKISNEASKKILKKKPVKKEDVSSDSSDDEKEPLSTAKASWKKKDNTATSSDSDSDVPLGKIKKSTPEKKPKIEVKKNGKSDSDADSDDTTESKVRKDSENEEDKSSSSSDSEKETPMKKMKTEESGDGGESTGASEPMTLDVVKKPPANNDDSSSDTSVYDSDPGNKKSKGRNQKKGKNSEDKEEKKPKKERSEKKTKAATEEEDPRLTKLKRCIREAGLRCAGGYNKLFADCESDKQRIKKLEQFFVEKGLTGAISLESCKAFRLKREEQKELDALDTKNIITEGRTRQRRAQNKLLHADDPVEAKEESDSGTNTSDEEAALEASRECKQLYSRLKGIIDSGEESD